MKRKALSSRTKRQLDDLLVDLIECLDDPEGRQNIENLRAIQFQIEERRSRQAQELSEAEILALKFIKKNLAKGHAPSVREITKAIGLRSSRSGHKVIQSLMNKKVLQKYFGKFRVNSEYDL